MRSLSNRFAWRGMEVLICDLRAVTWRSSGEGHSPAPSLPLPTPTRRCQFFLQGEFSCCGWHLYKTFTVATVHHPLKNCCVLQHPDSICCPAVVHEFLRVTHNVFRCSQNRRVIGLFVFPNLVRKFYKVYGCCCFVLEKYLRVWGSRVSSVTVISTEEVAFNS
jgi:hypothetical protein